MSSYNPRYIKSLEHWERSKSVVIPGSSTISKRADLYPYGAYPIYLEKAEGAEVIDIDGNRFVDFQSALGAVILGFNHPAVKRALFDQLELGTLFSLSHPSLFDLGKKILTHIPCAERIRILKNGSDATTGAVRIARAYTQREKILACHYHSWHDWYYVSTHMNAGIPSSLKNDVISFPYGDLDKFKELLQANKGTVAAVIMEVAHLHAPPKEYLESVKKLTHDSGALLIFDEVVTGFRFGLGGAQSYFNVLPDIACFAKALGNGSPISLIAGKEQLMEATQHVVTTQTYGEDCLAIAAAIATLEVIEKEPVVETIWQLGTLLKDGYNALAQAHGINSHCIGYPARLSIEFTYQDKRQCQFLKSYLLQETAKDGFLIAHMIFINYAHTKEHIFNLLQSIERIFKKLKSVDNRSLTYATPTCNSLLAAPTDPADNPANKSWKRDVADGPNGQQTLVNPKEKVVLEGQMAVELW
jgi:glutamate-1-semialdehyde aminotransferase